MKAKLHHARTRKNQRRRRLRQYRAWLWQMRRRFGPDVKQDNDVWDWTDKLRCWEKH